MKRAVFLVAAGATISAVWLMAQAPEVSMVDELDDTEHRMLPFIEKFRSIREAVKQFGRI